MSYSTIIGFDENADMEYVKELHNGHGSAPIIWGEMLKHYYFVERNEWVVKEELLENLWKRWQDLSMPKHHRAILIMSFDRCYVHHDYYERAARDIRQWLEDFDVPSNHVNHWPEIASFYEDDPQYYAIGIWHTSVTCNPYLGGWNEEKEDYETVGWEELCNLYKQLDSINNKKVEK